jgi:neutral ceramidase
VMRLGVRSEDFVLTATHTHNGPVVNADVTAYTLYNITSSEQVELIAAYADWVGERIVALVRDTLAAPAHSCVLDYRVTGQSFSTNREKMLEVETQVPVLVARAPDGDPLAILFGYGCHPVAAPILTEFDADFPGRAAAVIEQATGAFAQFLPGAAGDQDPETVHSWAAVDAAGTGLGEAAATAATTPGRPVCGPVASAYAELDVPLDLPPDLTGFRQQFAARQANTAMLGWMRRHAEIMVGQIDDGSYATSTVVPLQGWVFTGGEPLRIAMIGGEPVAGYAARLRQRYGPEGVWVVGYAGEVPAYLPTDHLLAVGGAWQYASGWSADCPQIGGGAMCCYGLIGHFRGNGHDGAVETTVMDGLAELLARGRCS